MTLLGALWGRVAGWLAAAGAGLLVLGTIYLRGRSAGAQAARDDVMRRDTDAWKKAADARASSVGAAAGSLRDDDGFKRD